MVLNEKDCRMIAVCSVSSQNSQPDSIMILDVESKEDFVEAYKEYLDTDDPLPIPASDIIFLENDEVVGELDLSELLG